MDSRRTVFLDLNGTLVAPVVVERLQDLTLIAGVSEAIARLSRTGYVCPVVTVQSRIEKGLFSEADFRAWFGCLSRELAAAGAYVVGPYVCPHRFRTPCACKKPQTLLYERAAVEHGLELRDAYVVGDSAADIEAALRFGGRGCFVSSGCVTEDADCARGMAKCSRDSMAEVVDWILAEGAAEQQCS